MGKSGPTSKTGISGSWCGADVTPSCVCAIAQTSLVWLDRQHVSNGVEFRDTARKQLRKPASHTRRAIPMMMPAPWWSSSGPFDRLLLAVGAQGPRTEFLVIIFLSCSNFAR